MHTLVVTLHLKRSTERCAAHDGTLRFYFLFLIYVLMTVNVRLIVKLIFGKEIFVTT